MNEVQTRPCPKCGKAMIEEEKFPGVWSCPDFKVTNDRKPFRVRCPGMEVTEEAAEAFDKECRRLVAESN